MKSHVGNREINGETYEIHANDQGTWSIMMPPAEEGERQVELGHGDTLDKAVAAARIQINKNKVKLNIPFVTLDGEHGIATGRHGRTRETLAVVDGQKTTVKAYQILRGDMPQEEIDRMLLVKERMAKLNDELREIINEYKFDLNEEVNRQITEGAQAAA